MPEAALARYRESGKVGATLAIAVPVYLGLAAGLGVLYQDALTANPLILLNFLAPIVFGAAAGGLALGALFVGKVRNRTVARLVVAAVLLVALLAAHARGLGAFDRDFPGVAAAIRRKLEPGNAAAPTAGMAPAGLLVFWIGEFLLFAIVGWWWPMAWWRRSVFCEASGRFVPRERIAVRYGPSAASLRNAAIDGGLAGLTAIALRKQPENDAEGEFRFYVHDAVESGKLYLTVQWFGQLRGPTGRKVVRDVIVLRRIEVTRELLDEWLG